MNISKVGAKILDGAEIAGSAVIGAGSGAAKAMDKLAGSIATGAEGKIGQIAGDGIVGGFGQRVARGLGTGVEGAAIGAAGGAVIGGVSGAIDNDETTLGGALKGAGAGALGGFALGGVSGFTHKSAGLFANTINDYHSVAAKMSKMKAGATNGINDAITNSNRVNAAFASKASYEKEAADAFADYAMGGSGIF